MSEDTGGGRGLSAERVHQTEEEAGALRLWHGAVLYRSQPGGVWESKRPGGVPEEHKELWEEEEDGREELLTDYL